MIGLTFLVFSLVENIFADFENRMIVLVLVFVSAVVLKEKGLIDIGLEKVRTIVNKKTI